MRAQTYASLDIPPDLSTIVGERIQVAAGLWMETNGVPLREMPKAGREGEGEPTVRYNK
jgi:hypothetical protein